MRPARKAGTVVCARILQLLFQEVELVVSSTCGSNKGSEEGPLCTLLSPSCLLGLSIIKLFLISVEIQAPPHRLRMMLSLESFALQWITGRFLQEECRVRSERQMETFTSAQVQVAQTRLPKTSLTCTLHFPPQEHLHCSSSTARSVQALNEIGDNDPRICDTGRSPI